ncbi:MAG: methyltransferase domain-containing protein [Rhodopseudomonas sp.]|uniref:class I SAM-dependent methyltransferase n=1 Tax=Rhodopseudomonas sp. TaxID=1078 RepID=UPI0017F1F51C|nr:methyltransferase domain-containing protein [Rhodopseudomonas sp.]NVN88429.1 methyltransferase domain-containing protein [Rhodopseudomonas sp.]
MDIEKSNEPDAYLAFEREGWAAVMAGYKDGFASVTQQTIAPLLDAANVQAGMRVADICCGPGLLAAAAVARGASAIGIDFPGVVAFARSVVPEAEFRAGDATDLPFADSSFDAILCGYGILHVPDPEKTLQEMLRVLKPGGRAAVSVWDSETPNNGLGLIFRGVHDHGSLNVTLPHGPNLFQFSTPDKLRAALTGTGFASVEVSLVPQNWPLESGKALIDAAITGTVRARTILAAQTPEAIDNIAAFIDKAVPDERGGGIKVPMPALVGSGVKP